MARLTINTGNRNIDGTYELDLSRGFNFTKAEWYLIRQRFGVVVNDIMPGSPLDINVVNALGLIALERAGKGAMVELYMATTDEQTTWEWDEGEVAEGEDEALPPRTGSVDSATASENGGSSGGGMSTSSEPYQAMPQAPTGE